MAQQLQKPKQDSSQQELVLFLERVVLRLSPVNVRLRVLGLCLILGEVEGGSRLG